MSRNLGERTCYFCGGDVATEETPRPATEDDCGPYFPEYSRARLMVANARCVDCRAMYLAWVSIQGSHPRGPEGCGFFDLSFRSTFNDEPGRADLPMFDIVVKRERVPIRRCGVCETPLPRRSGGYCYECHLRMEHFA